MNNQLDLPSEISRRGFLGLTGSGIFLFFFIGKIPAFAAEGEPHPTLKKLPTDFNAFLKIDSDGQVHCYTGKIEMGQGVNTSLAMMIADELDVAVESIKMVMGDTDLCPWDMGTWGSLTTRVFGPALRSAGAEARQVLLELASAKLKQPVEKLNVKDGIIFESAHPENKTSYGELARGKTIERHLSGKVTPKASSAFKVMGQSTNRFDSLAKVTGAAQFAGDIRPKKMLYAKILRPKAHGAKLIHLDISAAQHISGVKVVQEGDFVAILHPNLEMAEEALNKVKATYEYSKPDKEKTNGKILDEQTIFDHFLKVALEATMVAQSGDLKTGTENATVLFEQTYLNDYVAHAAIEPHTVTIEFDGKKATVWASTQTPFTVKDEVVKILNLDPKNVRVMPVFVGGGFGGKSQNLQVTEAARTAKLIGKPAAIQVAWNRREEFFNDTFRPAAVVKIKSGLNKDGRICLWDYDVYCAGDRGAAQFYNIPNHRTRAFGTMFQKIPNLHPFSVGAWRAPGNSTNTFAREVQMDVMAAKLGVDPVAFRLKHFTDPKWIRLLKTTAEKFAWTSVKNPSGRGFGVACGEDAGTLVAMMVEISVDKSSGQIHVIRALAVQDMGLVVNPKGAALQMEGCVNMGLGYALTERVRFKGREILDDNFDSYEIPKFSWIPKIETATINDPNAAPQGGGEPAIITVGAAIANAVFDLTGARIYQLPLTPERVKSALHPS